METIPVMLLFLGHMFVDACQGILPVVVTKQKALFNLSYFEVGLIILVLNVTSSVVQPIFGFISDKFRTSWFIPVGLMWTATAMGLIGWSPSYPVSVLVVGLAGLGTAAFHPRSMMSVFMLSGDKKGLGTALFSTGGNIGFAIGPIVGGFLVLGFGLHATIGLLLPCALLCLIILFYPGNSLRQEYIGSKKVQSFAGPAPGIPWGSLISVSSIITVRSWVYISFITFMPLYMQGRGIELKWSSMILTIFLASGAIAGLYGGHLSDRFGRKGIIVYSSLLYPLFAILMIESDGPWLWIAAAAAGAALLASFSVTIVLTQELMPRNLGLASGLSLGLSFGTGGVGSALTGFLADHYGLENAFWILSVVPITAALLTIFIKTPQPGGASLESQTS